MNLNEWVKEAYAVSVSKGWHDQPTDAELDAEATIAFESEDIEDFAEMIERIRKGDACMVGVASDPGARAIARRLSRLSLIVTEVGEAMSAVRRGSGSAKCDKPIGLTSFEEEIADMQLRIFDLCGEEGIDLEHIVLVKHEYNKTRERKHGGKLV